MILTVTVAALTGAIVQGPTWGWDSPTVLALLAGSVLALFAFWWRCGHHAHPLFELELLRVRPFVLATSAVFAFSIAFAIMLLSNALWCESVWHYSALRTGFAMAAGPADRPVRNDRLGPPGAPDRRRSTQRDRLRDLRGRPLLAGRAGGC